VFLRKVGDVRTSKNGFDSCFGELPDRALLPSSKVEKFALTQLKRLVVYASEGDRYDSWDRASGGVSNQSAV
jgi:hypothetical protein